MIPFFGLDREYNELMKEYHERLEKVLHTGKVLQGPSVKELEAKIAAQVGRSHAVACGSCTDALFFALTALGIGEGHQVLVTDLSFIASASAIIRTGATPIFIDIEDSYQMDLKKAQDAITHKTRAILYVQLFGSMGDPNKLREFASRNALFIIEDAAQAFGASYGKEKAGSIGHVSCFSFDPTKVLGAPGSGGMALTNDKEVARLIRLMRYHGRNEEGDIEILGYNSQMPSITAELLLLKNEYDAKWREHRNQIAEIYKNKLDGIVTIQGVDEEVGHAYHKFVIESEKRDQIQSALIREDIKCMVHYNRTLSNQLGADYDNEIAEEKTKKVLSLPISSYTTESEALAVCQVIRKSVG